MRMHQQSSAEVVALAPSVSRSTGTPDPSKAQLQVALRQPCRLEKADLRRCAGAALFHTVPNLSCARRSLVCGGGEVLGHGKAPSSHRDV